MGQTLQTKDYRKYRHHILTGRSLTIVTDSDPIQITDKDPRFDDATELVKNGKYDDLMVFFSREASTEVYCRGIFTFLADGSIQITESGEILPPVLGSRMVAFMDAQVDFDPLLNFWERLKKNPDEHVREQAYAFLEKNAAVFLEDGKLLLYKKVNEDFSAWHSDAAGQKVFWRVGTTVRMPRAACAADPNVACSAGLHAAAWGYAQNFNGSRLIEIEVDPEHIVSIPYDYGSQKLRCCEAYVRAVNEHGKWIDLTDAKKPARTVLTKSREKMVSNLQKGTKVRLPVSGGGYLNIPAQILRMMNLKPGEKPCVVHPTPRHRSLLLGRKRTVVKKGVSFSTETTVLVGGNARVRLGSLKEAGIDGSEFYSITIKPGNVLEIRRA